MTPTRDEGGPRLRSTLARVGVALLVIALFTSAVAPFAATAADSTTVEGTVTDVDTGMPVQNATVTTWNGDTLVAETTTDENGQYAVDAENATRIEVSADGYDDQSRAYDGNSTEDFALGSTPRYEFTLPAGDAYAVGVPGPIEADTVGDLFDPFQGVIYGYDGADGWQQVGHDASLGSLEALVVVVDEDADTVQLTMTFDGTAGVDDGTPPDRQLADGWNFVSPPQSDADAAFSEAEEILDQGYAEPQSQQVEGEDAFTRESLGSSDLRVNPFKGYFVRTDGGATVQAEAYQGITRTVADGLLALGTGSVEGTVTNESGHPVANATVNVPGAGDATTDADGTYSIGSVPAGLNTVEVDADGYAPADRPVAVRVNERATADVTLLEQPEIEGRVTDAELSADDGIENATVVVERRADDGSLEVVRSTDTNATGHYAVHVPQNDTYNVSVEAADHVDASNRTVEVGQDDVAADFALEPLDGELVGTLTDAVLAGDDAIGGVEVVVVNGTEELNATTDENGTFSVNVSAHVEYDVTFNASDHVDENFTATTGANETTDVSRELDPRNATISGNVTDAKTGDPITGATVNVTDGSVEWSTETAADGSYEVEVPPHREYTVTADTPDHAAVDATVAVGAGDDYRNGSQVREFALVPLGRIAGEIGAADGAELTDASGEPVNATVTIADQNGSFNSTTETATGGGAYSFVDLKRDTTYDLTITAPDHVTFRTEVSLPTGDADKDVSRDLQEGGYLYGDVVDFDANPIPGANVTIVRPEPGNVTVVTDSNGEFETPVVPTGSYEVYVEADGYSDRTFDRNVTQGGSETRFPLVADATINGTLTDADIGEPIQNGTVVAVDGDGNEYRTENVTADGNYSLTVGGDAEYQVRANASDHFESANQTVQVGGGEQVEGVDFALDPKNATIDGTVADAKLATDDAIANATVTVEEADGMPLTGFSTTVETDENGSYAVEVPAHADYNVSVAAADHEDGGPKTVTVGAGESYKGGGETVEFALTPLPTDVSGTVTDAKLESDDAIVGANVTVYRVNDSGADEVVGRTQTDDTGAYLVENVAPHETYRVNVTAVDHADPQPVERDAGAGDAYKGGPVVADFELAPLDGSISGTLTDSQTGEPITDATVVAYVENSSIEVTATTDSDGAYTISDVPAHEEYHVYGDDQDYQDADPLDENQLATVTVGANESVEGVALELDPKPATVTGTVTDAELEDDPDRDEAIPNVTVTVYESAALDIEVANDTTGADGSYRIDGIPADGSNYTVEFDAPDHENAQTAAFTPDANETVVRDASLEPLDGVIEGSVTEAGSGDTIEATVWIKSEDGEVDSMNTGGLSGPGYSFSGVNASKNWTIIAEADGYKDEEVTRFLEANGNVEEHFELEPKDGTVSGTVTDAENGSAIEGANVTVEGDGFNETVQTNASGQYEVSVPTPAEYTVSVEAADYLPENATVQVDSGGSATQDFSLQRAGHVFGKVTDTSGHGIENVQVTIYVEDSLGNEEVVATATTDANGDYETEQFRTGDYQIRFEKTGYQTSEGNVTVAQGANQEDEIMREA